MSEIEIRTLLGSKNLIKLNEVLFLFAGNKNQLNEIFKKNKSFTIPNLMRDAEEKWRERAKDLENINLTSGQ